MTMFRLGVISLAALCVGAAAHAQPVDEARLRPAWLALDKNHDGKVTLDEVPPMLAIALRLHDFEQGRRLSPSPSTSISISTPTRKATRLSPPM